MDVSLIAYYHLFGRLSEETFCLAQSRNLNAKVGRPGNWMLLVQNPNLYLDRVEELYSIHVFCNKTLRRILHMQEQVTLRYHSYR